MRDASSVVLSGRYASTGDYAETFDESCIKAHALDPQNRCSTVAKCARRIVVLSVPLDFRGTSPPSKETVFATVFYTVTRDSVYNIYFAVARPAT